MRKLLLLHVLLLIFSYHSFAQSDIGKEDVKQGKYTIKLIRNQDTSFGYEIHDADGLIIKQSYKPYFMVPVGFSQKENALIIARWHVNELQRTNKKKISMNLEKAKNLGVNEADLSINGYKTKN